MTCSTLHYARGAGLIARRRSLPGPRQCRQSERTAMIQLARPASVRTIALSAAIVLCIALPASAAARHHHVTRVNPEIYNVAPDSTGASCSPVHPPLCSNICSGAGPCAPPDSW